MNVYGTCQYFLSMMMSLKSAGSLLCFWRGWDCTTQGKRRDLGELTRLKTDMEVRTLGLEENVSWFYQCQLAFVGFHASLREVIS